MENEKLHEEIMASAIERAKIMEKLSNIENTLGEIKKQTTLTNGRVRALENWRWLIVGGILALSGVFAIAGRQIIINTTELRTVVTTVEIMRGVR